MLDLDRQEAVELLFGIEALRDPAFDAAHATFRSGADVCEDLYAHFGLDDEKVDEIAAEIRHDDEVADALWDERR
jgi:hypothetical protein